jgi:hypothetical protein
MSGRRRRALARLSGGLLSSGLLGSSQALLGLSCGGPNLAVPSYPQPDFARSEIVASPPPPPQIESLNAEPPSPGCRWQDGQWLWVSQRWDWRPGGWVQPPEACRYSAPQASWGVSQGSAALYYRPGRWYSVSQPKTCPDPAPCPGAVPESRAASSEP